MRVFRRWANRRALRQWRRRTGHHHGLQKTKKPDRVILGERNRARGGAEQGWQAWTARYPEAAAAHAAEHALIAGDRTGAVRHARANHANRPYGDASILLATALAAAGDIDDARRLVERTAASGWNTSESDRLRFELAALAGDSAAAEQARAVALARNPRAFDPAARLILFGLH